MSSKSLEKKDKAEKEGKEEKKEEKGKGMLERRNGLNGSLEGV